MIITLLLAIGIVGLSVRMRVRFEECQTHHHAFEARLTALEQAMVQDECARNEYSFSIRNPIPLEIEK